jgi:hypothetical protein
MRVSERDELAMTIRLRGDHDVRVTIHRFGGIGPGSGSPLADISRLPAGHLRWQDMGLAIWNIGVPSWS